MNFFGMGPGELMLIALLGMIIFGPGKLPEIASQLGRTVRDFRRSTAEINSEFQRAFSLDEPEAAPEPVGEATGEVNGSAPLANSSEWNWESSGAEQPSAEAAPPPSPPSFWDWDSPEPA